MLMETFRILVGCSKATVPMLLLVRPRRCNKACDILTLRYGQHGIIKHGYGNFICVVYRTDHFFLPLYFLNHLLNKPKQAENLAFLQSFFLEGIV